MQGDIGVARSFDQGATWEFLGIALDEAWHLSYPFVFKYENEVDSLTSYLLLDKTITIYDDKTITLSLSLSDLYDARGKQKEGVAPLSCY
jgi:hypothetical protein